MEPQFLPVVNQAPTVGANQNAYLNAARGYIPDPANAAGLGLPQQYTTYQASDGDPEVMRQAYAEQEARLGPMRLPSETSDDGLGLTPTTRAMPVSSGGDSDWNWLTAIGAGLQSAGAAHFGNFNVPQQYLQLKAEADRRKQEYAMQQAKMAEDKRNHQWSQVFQTLSNEHLGAPQRIEVLKSLKDNPFAAEAAQSVNAKMIGDFKAAGEFLPRKPEGYAKALQDGTMDWHQLAAETKMGLKLKEQVAEKQASVLAYKTLERMAREQPDNEPIQEAFREAQAEKQKKIADANVAVASAPSEIRNNQLKPDLTQSQIDKNRHEGGDWTKLASSLAQGMYGVSPNQITADQVNSQEDVQRASQMGLTIQPGAPRFATLAKMSEIEVPERVAEAGARAREQVKVETNLAPGVMMLDTLSKLTEKPGMVVS